MTKTGLCSLERITEKESVRFLNFSSIQKQHPQNTNLNERFLWCKLFRIIWKSLHCYFEYFFLEFSAEGRTERADKIPAMISCFESLRFSHRNSPTARRIKKTLKLSLGCANLKQHGSKGNKKKSCHSQALHGSTWIFLFYCRPEFCLELIWILIFDGWPQIILTHVSWAHIQHWLWSHTLSFLSSSSFEKRSWQFYFICYAYMALID